MVKAGEYAAKTSVTAAQSREEIEDLLMVYGATDFHYATVNTGRRAMVAFRAHGRNIKFELEMPDPMADEYVYTPAKRLRRDEAERRRLWERACWARWRALALLIHALLEGVELGILSFEEAFLTWTLLPSGQTVSEAVEEQLPTLLDGSAPLLLLAGAR